MFRFKAHKLIFSSEKRDENRQRKVARQGKKTAMFFWLSNLKFKFWKEKKKELRLKENRTANLKVDACLFHPRPRPGQLCCSSTIWH